MVSNLWLLLSGREALYLIAKDDSCLLLKMPITVLTSSLNIVVLKKVFIDAIALFIIRAINN